MKAFVIAGGVPQIELIKQLKERGINTVFADGSPNAVAKPFCDQFYQVNIFDIEAVKEIAEKEKVDFLITVCADQVLLVVAEVSEILGLPCYIDFKTTQDVSDKIRMKRIFREAGIPTTKFVETDHLDLFGIRGDQPNRRCHRGRVFRGRRAECRCHRHRRQGQGTRRHQQ